MRKRVEETLDLLGLAEVAQPSARDLERRAAAAGSDRVGAHVAPARPRARRTDVAPWTRRPPKKCWPRCSGWCTTSVSPSCSPSTDSNGSSSTPTSVVLIPGHGEALVAGLPADVMRTAPVAPPVVELGRLGGWTPLPLSVRDARRAAADMRDHAVRRTASDARRRGLRSTARPDAATWSCPTARCPRCATSTVELAAGEIVAVMGRNGAGQVVAAEGPGRPGQALPAAIDVGGLDPRGREAVDPDRRRRPGAAEPERHLVRRLGGRRVRVRRSRLRCRAGHRLAPARRARA